MSFHAPRESQQVRLPVNARLPSDLVDALDALVSRASGAVTRTDILALFVQAGIQANNVTEKEIAEQRRTREANAKAAAESPGLSLINIPGERRGGRPAKKRAPFSQKRRVRDSATGVANSPQPPIHLDECENRTVKTRGGQHAA